MGRTGHAGKRRIYVLTMLMAVALSASLGADERKEILAHLDFLRNYEVVREMDFLETRRPSGGKGTFKYDVKTSTRAGERK